MKEITPPFGGYIHWNDDESVLPTKCQCCHAVLAVDSKFALSPDKPIMAKLELTPQDGRGYILKITQVE